MKYNFLLRGAHEEFTNAFIDQYIATKCQGNTYPTTLLYICLGIAKLSLITKAQKVYRAPGGRLPPSFWEHNNDDSRGGVELGFMSTTTDKSEAMKYAMYSGAPIIFEVQQGMVAKGAEYAPTPPSCALSCTSTSLSPHLSSSPAPPCPYHAPHQLSHLPDPCAVCWQHQLALPVSK